MKSFNLKRSVVSSPRHVQLPLERQSQRAHGQSAVPGQLILFLLPPRGDCHDGLRPRSDVANEHNGRLRSTSCHSAHHRSNRADRCVLAGKALVRPLTEADDDHGEFAERALRGGMWPLSVKPPSSCAHRVPRSDPAFLPPSPMAERSFHRPVFPQLPPEATSKLSHHGARREASPPPSFVCVNPPPSMREAGHREIEAVADANDGSVVVRLRDNRLRDNVEGGGGTHPAHHASDGSSRRSRCATRRAPCSCQGAILQVPYLKMGALTEWNGRRPRHAARSASPRRRSTAASKL